MRAVVRLYGRSDRGPVPPQAVTRSIRIAAAVPSTRTELAPDGYNVLWTPGDRIGIYVKSGDTFTTVNAPLTFEGTEAAANGTFGGEITLAEGASDYTLLCLLPRGRSRRRPTLRRSPLRWEHPRYRPLRAILRIWAIPISSWREPS